MGIRVESKQKGTIKATSLKMGNTFLTPQDRKMYLICSESDDIGDGRQYVVCLITGIIESIHNFEADVIPIDLVITEE